MASGIKIVGVFIFWAVLGLSWAILNENSIEKLPSQNPQMYSLEKNNYDLFNWAWKIGVVGLCIGSAISILGQRGFKGAIVNSMVLFSGLFIVFFFWATFYIPINVTIPTAFASGFGTVTNVNSLKDIYNSSLLIMMLGICLLTFFTGGTAIIGRRRYRSQRLVSGGGGSAVKDIIELQLKQDRRKARARQRYLKGLRATRTKGVNTPVGVSVYDASYEND